MMDLNQLNLIRSMIQNSLNIVRIYSDLAITDGNLEGRDILECVGADLARAGRRLRYHRVAIVDGKLTRKHDTTDVTGRDEAARHEPPLWQTVRDGPPEEFDISPEDWDDHPGHPGHYGDR
jgi:hypothetical protein